MCSLWAAVPKTCRTRQSVLHCLPNWALDRGAVVFTSHANSNRSAPAETSSRVFRFYLDLSGMMPAYSCNHMLDSSVAPTIIYWTAYGCIKFCNLVAYNCTHVSLATVKSCFGTILLTEFASTALSRGFFMIDKLFITFGGRTAISGLIVW